MSRTGESWNIPCNSLSHGVVTVWDSRFGAGSWVREQSWIPERNLDRGVLVNFWIRITGEHPLFGFKIESDWIPVDLRNWPYP